MQRRSTIRRNRKLAGACTTALLFVSTVCAIPALRAEWRPFLPPVRDTIMVQRLRVAIVETNPMPPSPAPEPVRRPARKKAGFLAGAGLAILSLLVLATGLALLRAFRQR